MALEDRSQSTQGQQPLMDLSTGADVTQGHHVTATSSDGTNPGGQRAVQQGMPSPATQSQQQYPTQVPVAYPAMPKQTMSWQQVPPLATSVAVVTTDVISTDATSRSPFPVPRGDQEYYNQMPRRVICQYCGYEIITSINRRPGFGAHLFALGMCLVGLWPCCIIPYFVDDCQDATHFCPNCGQEVGEKRFL
jgi:lipopolysaccharide-induced tumor necrosis factor-alpha factor